MKHLVEKGLMYGNLVQVDSPVLVDRYNRALAHLANRQTTLTSFHIDLSGYSPEIGDELDDPLYLNHEGVNRQIILLGPEQKSAPLLNAQFSTSRDILRQFIHANEAQIFALTATDAIAGELVNSVFHLDSPARLFDIRKITVEADTPAGHLRKADELAALVRRFREEDGAWMDDALINQMIALAGTTGDVTRTPLRFSQTTFEKPNFWTAHFGGLYLFPGLKHPAAIATGDKEDLGELPVKYLFDLSERNRIAKFLDYNGLAEPVIRAPGVDAAAILRQKMDFIVADVAASRGARIDGLDRAQLRRLTRHHAEELPPEYHGLQALVGWAEDGRDWPRIGSDHPAYFYSLRAADTPDRDLVNMLLSELSPLDFRQLFICHKEAFYRRYRTWSEEQQAFVAQVLAQEYLVDKAGARAALFGQEPAMIETAPARVPDALIRRVGPWGAVRRR